MFNIAGFIEFHASNAFMRGVTGSGRNLRISICIQEMLARCKEQNVYEGVRRSKWAIIGSTYAELRGTTMAAFLDGILGKTAQGYSLKVDRNAPMRAMLNGQLDDDTRVEAEFIFLEQGTDIGNLNALELTGCWLTDACNLPRIVPMACYRVRRFPYQQSGGYNWSGIIIDAKEPQDIHCRHEENIQWMTLEKGEPCKEIHTE